MKPLEIDKEFTRVRILGARVHHGTIGLALMAMGLAGKNVHPPLTRACLILTGVLLVVDDWDDIPWVSDHREVLDGG